MHAASYSTTLFVSESSFLRPVIARSVCVRNVYRLSDPASLCPRFDKVFSRGFFGLINFHVRQGARFNETVDMLSMDHPCKTLNELQCAAHYVSAVTGTSVPQAASAAKCRRVLAERDCTHLKGSQGARRIQL